MNSDVSIRLKRIVERAVRPVVAGRALKRKMREELLAHVTEVYDDERARLGDDDAALARTRERLGNPDALTGELQRSVPLGNRLAAWTDRLGWSSDEPLWRLAARHILVAVAVYIVVFLVLLPPTIFNSDQYPLTLALRVSGGQALIMGPFLFLFVVVSSRLARAAFGTTAERSWRLAAIYFVAAAMLIPSLAFCNYWLLTGDLAGSVRHLLIACWFLPAFPPLFAVIARLAYKELAYEKEWAGLALGE